MIAHGKIETAIYFIIWSSGVSISLYSLFLAGNNFNHSDHHLYHYDDFSPGWFNRFQDTSDFEWACWTKLTIRLIPWLLMNSIGGEILRRWQYFNILPLWYFTISFCAVSVILGTLSALLLTGITVIFQGCVYLKQPFLIWVLGFLWRRYVPSDILAKTEDDVYLIEVASSWLVLRCFAYSFEALKESRSSLPVVLAYSLYLPTIFCGPFVSFPSFLRGLVAPARPWHLQRVITIARAFARCLFWFAFTILALNFIYVNAILLRPYMVAGMTTWQLAGLGIAMGHFFHLKYVVFYGLPSAWAGIEGFATPKPPCCVSRVYLYSFMWRYFDPGLYSFLVRYIYVPVLKLSKTTTLTTKLGASIVCFLFVYVWHGEGEYVLYWVILNFIAVTIEAIGRTIVKTPTVARKLDSTISKANQRRLHCLLASPLHYFSMLSNYFFIGNFEVGKIYFNRASRESFTNTLYILFVLYGAAQTTVTIEKWERT